MPERDHLRRAGPKNLEERTVRRCDHLLDVSFQKVVHSGATGETGVAKLQKSTGRPE